MPNITFNRQTTLTFPGSQISDITSGIVNGSLVIREILCSDRIAFGDINSNQFQCQLYDCPNLTGKKIQVIQTDNGTNKTLFTGWVDSCKTDDLSGFKTIVAYDYFYKARKKKIKAWWKSYWASREQSTIGAMWKNLLSYYNISYTDTTLICDGIVVKKTKKLKRLKTTYLTNFLSQVCEINLCIAHMNREGVLEFKQFTSSALNPANAIDIRDYYTISKSKFEDYAITPYNKVELYDNNNKLIAESGSGNNKLVIQNNVFLFNQEEDWAKMIADYMMNGMYQFNYIPANITMKVSNLDIKLGDIVRTQKGYCLVCENDYTGSLLVDQAIVSNNQSEYDEPNAGTTLGNIPVRDMERLDYNIDTDSDVNLDLDIDTGEISVVNKDAYYYDEDKVTRKFDMWEYNFNFQAPYNWSYWHTAITLPYPFVLCTYPDLDHGNPRYCTFNNQTHQSMVLMAVTRLPQDVGDYFQLPAQSWTHYAGNSQTSYNWFGDYVHKRNNLLYYYTGTGVGTIMYGLLNIEPDYRFNSLNEFFAAMDEGTIEIPGIVPDDKCTLATESTGKQAAANAEYIAEKMAGNNPTRQSESYSGNVNVLSETSMQRLSTALYSIGDNIGKADYIETMTGATAEADGKKGLVPAPLIADRTKFLCGDGTWELVPQAVEITQAEYDALPSAEKTTDKKIYCIKDAGGSGGGGGGASAIAELTDVELTDLADGEILKYDATEEKWVNANESGGDASSVELTWDEYQALSSEEKHDLTKVYYINDYGTGSGTRMMKVDSYVTSVTTSQYGWIAGVKDKFGNNLTVNDEILGIDVMTNDPTNYPRFLWTFVSSAWYAKAINLNTFQPIQSAITFKVRITYIKNISSET